MPSDDKYPLEYLISLLPEENERLTRAAEHRAALDSTVGAGDIIVEAVREHLDRLTRPLNAGRDGRPERPGTLFLFLFGGDAEAAFERLSEGIVAMTGNADGLLEDAAVLVDAKRYERAEFLIATAQEEMGKAYILLDMCRVDLARHQHVLRHLCRSFYSHVLKHVYFDLSANEYAGISTLSEVKHYFRISATEWWPSSPESGEPDMPHDTFFLREANLYVDVDSYSETWMMPRLPSKALMFETAFMGTPLDRARDALGKFRVAHEAGLFRPEALRILNRAMKSLVVTKHTSMEKLLYAYERAGSELEAHLGIPSNALKESTVHNWPMYWIRR